MEKMVVHRVVNNIHGYIKTKLTYLDVLMYVLEKWVSIRTVSGNPQYLEECRKGARFFKNILQQLGAKSQLVKKKKKLVYCLHRLNFTNRYLVLQEETH